VLAEVRVYRRDEARGAVHLAMHAMDGAPTWTSECEHINAAPHALGTLTYRGKPARETLETKKARGPVATPDDHI
jgi:hypothetical protein